MSRSSPLVGLSSDCRLLSGRATHTLGDKYARAVVGAAGCVPLVLPAMPLGEGLAGVLGALDGVVLTGSLSNVHPSRYGVAATPAHEPYDEARDALTFELLAAVLELGVPLLAICRGFQELNVALGGTLHARVHELPGRLDHRAPQHEDPDVRYGPAHEIWLRPGGLLHGLLGAERVGVNSIHGQGIDRLATRLEVEAEAPDGTVEAVSVRAAAAFALGVQWHPEYRAVENPVSRAIYAAFGAACAARAAARGD